MTITKQHLAQWQENMRVSLNKAQETAILTHFGTEPEPYEWTEQDITEQIRYFLDYGSFVKREKDDT